MSPLMFGVKCQVIKGNEEQVEDIKITLIIHQKGNLS